MTEFTTEKLATEKPATAKPLSAGAGAAPHSAEDLASSALESASCSAAASTAPHSAVMSYSAAKPATADRAADQPFLVVRNLCKHYGEGPARVTVLRDVSATVMRGEICVLLGPSGSGKSTFLNLVGGLEAADAGSIRVDEQTLTGLNAKQLGEYRRSELGFVFQFYNLVPDLTIRENIEVCQHLSKNPLPMDDLLQSLGLWEHRAKFPRQVSGGQQQRCAIGRALVKNPSLLLCDEPTGALDYQTSKEILELMEQVNRDFGCTIVIVTHNDAIKHMANRVLRLRDGALVEDSVNKCVLAARDLEW